MVKKGKDTGTRDRPTQQLMSHWAVNYSSPQGFIITFSYSLAYKLWGLLFNFDRLVH